MSVDLETANPTKSDGWQKTLPNLLLRATGSHASVDALVLVDERLSYAALAERALKRARELIALGVNPGDHVGILMPTCLEFVENLFAVSLVGAVAVPINARYRAVELAYLIENADLVGVITTDRVADHISFVERLNDALPSLRQSREPTALNCPEAPLLRWLLLLGAGSTAAPHMLKAADIETAGRTIASKDVLERARAVDEAAIALILYTSGTTSNPKGCLVAHGSMVRNSVALAERYQLTASDLFWSPLPMFHIAAILPLVATFAVGGTYLTMGHFDAGKALAMMASEKVTVTYPCFVTIMLDLVNHSNFATTDLSSVRLMNSSLVMAPPALAETLSRALPNTIHVGTYGLTEGAGTISTSKLDDPREQRLGRLGKPLPGWEVRIVDSETGKEVPPGTPGEILARGPGVLNGYYKDPIKTAQAIDPEGWLHTGDVGSLDANGTMMFHGRLKDMLKVGGENVAAAEIESFLCRHPSVKLAQVVGVPDPRLEEVPAAFIELQTGMQLNEETVLAFCHGQISKFKTPRFVRFVEEWPMSASKIQKFKLRERLLAELSATSGRS